MKHLHIDIETYSSIDVTKAGVYRHSRAPDFQIVLFAYAYGDDDPTVIDCFYETTPGEFIPDEVWSDMQDPRVLKIAHNANFEMTCIATYYGLTLDPAQWYCTQVAAAYLGLPLSLEMIAKVLHLPNQKGREGKALINFFSKPCKPTKTNGGRTRNDPEYAPAKWQEFADYNAQDVRTECDIYAYLQRFPKLPAIEWKYWQHDQEINARGIHIDADLVRAAIDVYAEFMEGVHAEIMELTGVNNPNSGAQLRAWLTDQLGEPVTSISKEPVNDLLATDLPDNVRRVLELLQLAARKSVSKYNTALTYMCDDGKVYGQIQFYGANRTGRFAAKGIQIHNLKKMLGKFLATHERIVTAREALRKHLTDVLYDDTTDVISQLIRSIFIAGPGNKIISCDFSAIEARVLAWLAGEDWKLEVFRTHGKIYEATAAKMFNVPIEEVTKASPYRAKGKVSELALGYQGGAGALITMGALREGLTEEELPALVALYRAANPKTKQLWRDVENAFKKCYRDKMPVILRTKYTQLRFTYDRGYVFIELPSGRKLSYFGVNLVPGKYGESITYMAVDQLTRKWVPDDTYGGSLVENITQAIARDCLVECMYAMRSGVDIIFHVHDEIVAEDPAGTADECLQYMIEQMSVSPLWAPDLPLSGEGYISDFYKKD